MRFKKTIEKEDSPVVEGYAATSRPGKMLVQSIEDRLYKLVKMPGFYIYSMLKESFCQNTAASYTVNSCLSGVIGGIPVYIEEEREGISTF